MCRALLVFLITTMTVTGLMTDDDKDDVDWCNVHFPPPNISLGLIDVLIYGFIV